MSTVARRFLASPARLSSDTWKAISALICQTNGSASAEFEKVAGLASCILNDGVFADNPVVVKNEGPRLRVYCLYGEDAMSGEDQNEDSLTWKPTEKEWHVFLPCVADEFEETAKSLKGKSAKFSVYNIDKGIPDDEVASKSDGTKSEALTVDWGAFKTL
jgi:hypothetical protein